MSYSELISEESDTEEEEDDETNANDEDDEVEPPAKKVRARPTMKAKTPVASPKAIKRKVPVRAKAKSTTPPKIYKKTDVVMDISEPEKPNNLMVPFCCKIADAWAEKVIQFSSHGTPFIQLQNVDDKLEKKYGVQLPIDKARKLMKGISEAIKHCEKHK